jgi:hypothetical protein
METIKYLQGISYFFGVSDNDISISLNIMFLHHRIFQHLQNKEFSKVRYMQQPTFVTQKTPCSELLYRVYTVGPSGVGSGDHRCVRHCVCPDTTPDYPTFTGRDWVMAKNFA